MPPLMASSALKEQNFDLIKTVDAAVEFDFPGVQLFVNKSLQNPVYYQDLLTKLVQVKYVVLHLPNLDVLTEDDVYFSGMLTADLKQLTGVRPRTLVHYVEGLTAADVPVVAGRKVGIENAKTGTFDPQHVLRAKALARSMSALGSFQVLDIGRFSYASEAGRPSQILEFMREQIADLNPQVDVIHLADKTSWTEAFRNAHCALGDGITAEVIPEIQEFSQAGGYVVFENEVLEEVVRGREMLEHES